MSHKIYLNLLIFSGILSPGILGTFLEDNYKNSSNLYYREKRMVDHADALFTTKVLKDGEKICTGVIVSPKHILVNVVCVMNSSAKYTVISGAPHISPIQSHHVVNMHKEGRPGNLVLLVIDPLISFAEPSMNRQMPIYQESLAWHIPLFIVINWDSTNQIQRMTRVRRVDFPSCKNIYRQHFYSVGDDKMCTVQIPGQRCLTFEAGDYGAALAVGYHLVAILAQPGSCVHPDCPDVFTPVNGNSPHHVWIMQYIHEYVRN